MEGYEPAFPNEPFFEPDDRAPSKPRGKPRKRFNRTCMRDIMAMEFDELRWAIPGYVREGLSVLAGRQKLGKTWLAMDWAIAVAAGGVAMGGVPVDAGDVLYIDMENGHRRMQRRIETLFPNERLKPDLSRLEIVTESPGLDEGFLDELDAWKHSVAKPKLVVIDVLQRIKPAGKASRNSYENDYSIFQDLQQWATGNGIAVVALHHTRKGGADDPLEALSGSNGLSACADATLVLDRTSAGTSLYVRGRDIEEKDTAIRFDGGAWSILGDAGEVRRSSERNSIVAALEVATEPMSPTDLADATGQSSAAVRKALGRMVAAGEIEKAGRGAYRRCDAEKQSSSHKCHNVTSYPESPGNKGSRHLELVTSNVTPLPARSQVTKPAADPSPDMGKDAASTDSFDPDVAVVTPAADVTTDVTFANADDAGVSAPVVTNVTLVTGDRDVTTKHAPRESKAGPGVTILDRKPREVGGAEYDERIDRLIALDPAAKGRLTYAKKKGTVIEEGGEFIWTRQ